MLKNSKRKFVRILAMMLAVLTAITSTPIEAHADGTGNTTDAGGNEGAGKKFKVGVGNNYMGWYRQTQGYRIYIINNKFERISPVYDFSLGRTDHEGTGWLDPVDWYKANVTEDDDTVYKWETRFDTENSPTSGNTSVSFEKLQEWCTYTESSLSDLNYTATLPPVIYLRHSDGSYEGQGTQFKDWFFAGQGGTNIQVGGTNIKETEIIVTGVTDDGKIKDTSGEGKHEEDNDKCQDCGGTQSTTMTCPACKGSGKISNGGLRITCLVCGGTQLVVINCPTCKGYECNDCKDTKICIQCDGTKEILIGSNRLACKICSATGKCQSCKEHIPQIFCTTCKAAGSIDCTNCNGTGSCGYRDCTTCVGRGTIKCPSCSTKVTCTKCNKDVTSYGGVDCEELGGKVCVYCLYKFNNDGQCNKCGATMTEKDEDFIGRYSDIELEDMPNSAQYDYCNYPEICCNCSVETCTVCGAIYDADGYCTYCKCPLCNSQMALKSEDNFYCSNCDRNIKYNQDVVKVEIPDSYWLSVSDLKEDTQNKITIANTTVIKEVKDYSPAPIYYENTRTYGELTSQFSEEMFYHFNNKYRYDNSEQPINPHDALLYALGRVAIDHYALPKWGEKSPEERKVERYCLYQAYIGILNNGYYIDCFYSSPSRNTSANPIPTATQFCTADTDSLLTVQIPLSGKDTTEDTKCKHDNIHPTEIDAMLCHLNQSGGLSPYKILATKPETITFPNGEYANALDALNDGGYLVVEPLIGVRIHLQENHGSHGDDGYETHWTYGSFWNIAQETAWASDGASNWYNDFVMNLAPNCLVTTQEVKSVTDDGIELVLLPAQDPNASKKISVSRNQMQNVQALYGGAEMHGLSMHIYGAEGNPQTITFDESLLNEDVADESDYPYLIGASPDHTDKVAEEKRSDPTKYANIVKFYETTDPVSGETTYKVFTREKIPELVEIVDEEHLTGYKLIEWFTSDKLCTNLEDPEITWEKLFSNDGFDRGKTGQHSIEYDSKHGTITTGLEPYTMNTKQRLNTSTGIVTEVEENTLYLLYRVGDATTSTYDEELGEEIGPSPDDTHKLVERTDFESFSTHEKYTTTPATIVKFYEEINLKGESISTEVFVRKEVPNTIEIEDESEFTGYALQEWFTASKYRAPKEEQTYAEFYEEYLEWESKAPAYWIHNEASIVGLDPDTPEYESELKCLFKTLKFTTEEGEETGEQVIYLHYTKSPSDPSTLAVTSTYDEALKENKGPAPNDSSRLTDEQIEAGEYINIVKFYEDTDPSDPSTSLTTKVFHRTQCPLVIAIQDESIPNADGTPRTGYEITEWFTSDQYLPADTLKDGDQYDTIKSTIKVINEGYHEQNISFTDHVYTPDITLIGEEDLIDYNIHLVRGNTLYIKLVKEGTNYITSTYDPDMSPNPHPAPWENVPDVWDDPLTSEAILVPYHPISIIKIYNH